MCLSPVSASASIRRTFSATGIIFFSDWKPSQKPSSLMVTRLGRSDISKLLRRSALFLLEGLLAGSLDAKQRHKNQQDGRGDQEAKADRPLDEYHRIATRKQHGTSEIFLHLRSQHQPQQERCTFAAEPDEDVAQHAEDRDLEYVERAVLQTVDADAAEQQDRRREEAIRHGEQFYPHPD